MKQYEVKTRFVFEGIFRVNAENREEVRENIEKHCGLVMGGSIHTTLNDEDIDWNFDTHPEQKIISIKQVRTKKLRTNITNMAHPIIDRICNSCSCGRGQAGEYLEDEIRNLRDLRDLDDLRPSDMETACDNLGLEHDYVEYFIENI